MDKIKKHKEEMKMLWTEIVVAVASSSNIANGNVCANWTDKVVIEFDKRFNPVTGTGVKK